MKMQDLKNMDKDELLGVLGLETKRSETGAVLKALGTFGVGLLVGAGVALLLAPKAGRELRQDLRGRLRRDGRDEEGLSSNGSQPSNAREPEIQRA
jgi:hypothetical protein